MQVFPPSSGGGEAMAKNFNVPFLGRLPLDDKLTQACEEGASFLEQFPTSVAAIAFSSIVEGQLIIFFSSENNRLTNLYIIRCYPSHKLNIFQVLQENCQLISSWKPVEKENNGGKHFFDNPTHFIK